MSQKIINKRSSVITEDGKPKLPSSDVLDYGEIAINYADGVETLSIKNSANEIIEFKSKDYVDNLVNNNIENTINITYAELVLLRDNANLKPGQQYRIIDYVTTTIQENTQSAGHQFDVIVTADDEKTLNEVARACLHDEDTYFADSDLNAWQIWYCLDNDTERFAWADDKILAYVYYYGDGSSEELIVKANHDDSAMILDRKVAYIHDKEDGTQLYITDEGFVYDESERTVGRCRSISYSGKGVIYRMIDEFGNDCPYDFKNIQFIRYELNAPETVGREPWMAQLSTNVQAQFSNNNLPYIWGGFAPEENRYWEDTYENIYSTPTGNKKAFYTFSTVINDVVIDHSLLQGYCYSNTIKEYITSKKQYLNNNVFLNTSKTSTCYSNSFGNDCRSNSFGNRCQYNSFGDGCNYNSFGDSCSSNSFGYYCDSNSFGNNCRFNSFGNNCYYNSFEYTCYSNSFGNSCNSNSFGKNCSSNSFGNGYKSNSFGNYCYSNSFGNDCQSNSFGYDCNYNTFGNSCESNSFGSNCYSNSFGYDCFHNSFGDTCYYNSFGNNCNYNSFGYDCSSNSFGNSCDYNSFGDGCNYNSFGNNCFHNSFRVSADKAATLKDYVQYNHFDDGCSYNVIWNSETTSSTVLLKNINVNRGVCGTESSYNMINIDTLNSEQEINVNQVDGIVSIGDILSIKYESLKTLRDNSQLIPGRQYRIIDYVTTTIQENTQSAGHQFDVIVTADDESTLNEVARVCLHEGDTYFAENDLNAWQIWYCLDNDTNRFEWADTTNGKGVIYRMIDERNNDCPYDFKNIQFIRYELNAPETVGREPWMAQLSTNIQAQFSNNNLPYIWGGFAPEENRYWEDNYQYIYSTPTGNIKAFYTFSTVINDVAIDHSLLKGYCYDNTIKEYIASKKQHLNNNVFLNTYKSSRCHSNSFGNSCYKNSFGDDCRYNSFGDDCRYNSFGNTFFYNSFGNNCRSNSFGNGCNSNSFGNDYSSNSFVNHCSSNSFGDNCSSNSFGSSCDSNSFGNSCFSNSFGDGCDFNSFGNYCYYNSFRVSANKLSTLKDYVRYNHFDDGCSYNVIWNSDTTSNSIQLQNINVNRGVCGNGSSYNYINIKSLNSEKEININNYNGHIYIDYGDIFNVTYNELVDLRDNAQLISGRQYRIIDYVTTTSQSNIRVTNKKFDIIVTALNEHTLSEDAHATHHDDNHYWNDIEKWEIKYDIDNDNLTYEWISNTDIPVLKKLGNHPSNSLGFTYLGTEICDFSNYGIYGDIEAYRFSCNDGNPDVKVFIYDAKYYRVVDEIPNEYFELELYLPSKGVIYYMKDEFGNEAGYDFKNILFMRGFGDPDLVINTENSQSLFVNNVYNLEENMYQVIPTYTNLEDFTVPYIYKDNIYNIDLKYTNGLFRVFYYTFNDATDKASDASINGKSHNNIIKPNYTPSSSKCRRLNNTIFIGECFDNKLELFNYENTIYNSNKITMNSSCGNNIIYESSNININNSCNRNVIISSEYINIGANSRFNHFYEVRNIDLGVLNECNVLQYVLNTILENNCYCISVYSVNEFDFSNSNTFKAMCNRISCKYLRACTIDYNSGILGVNDLYKSHIKNINGEISNSTNTLDITEITLDLPTSPENITIAKNSTGEIKIYCEADLIA